MAGPYADVAVAVDDADMTPVIAPHHGSPMHGDLGRVIQPPRGAQAVVGLSGEEVVATDTVKLLTFVAAQKLSPSGPVTQTRYNSPWKAQFLRRNEAMVAVGVLT